VEYCDYCHLEVKVAGFKMDYMDSEKIFCCEGCKAIYKLFGDAHVVKNNEQVASSISNRNYIMTFMKVLSFGWLKKIKGHNI